MKSNASVDQLHEEALLLLRKRTALQKQIRVDSAKVCEIESDLVAIDTALRNAAVTRKITPGTHPEIFSGSRLGMGGEHSHRNLGSS